jgi:ubiquinone biosynthesis protein COQ9
LCVTSGWNDETLKSAVVKAGFDEKFSELIFENGALEMADFFISESDQKMQEQIAALDLSKMKVREKIKESIKIRLMINQPYKTAIKKLLGFYLSLGKAFYAIKNCYKTADLIWYNIGDKSTDFNFYTKRIILSKVYIRTLVYFINDNSENNSKSWIFLDNQIEKVMQFEKLKSKVKNYLGHAEKISEKIVDLKQHFSDNSLKDLIKKLPFFRLTK